MKAMLAALALALPLAGLSEPITVTDTKGRSMDVEILSYIPSTGDLKIKRTDGQVFAVKLDVFDGDSRDRIKEKAPKERAELLVRVSVGKRRARQGDSSYMKDQTISATVTIENDSRVIDFAGGKGTLFLIARQTRRYAEDEADYGKVLSKQNFQIAVGAGKEFSYEAQPIITSYDSDRDSSNIGGWEYYGYLFILETSDGSIHTVETSIGNLKADVVADHTLAKKLLALDTEDLVEKNLERR